MKEKSISELIFSKIMRKQSLTDLDLQALVDNEVTEEERRQFMEILARDEDARRRYDRLIHQKSLVQFWWAQGARDH